MDKTYEIAFKLILAAGDSKSESMNAIRAAREGNFEKAKSLCEVARVKLTDAHKIQTDLIQAESRGEEFKLNLIMVHAQDHLSMALMNLDNAHEMTNLYKMIYELTKK